MTNSSHIGSIRNMPANSELGHKAQENARVAANFKRRRYSLELLNLGAERATEIGPKAAAQELGIGYEALRKHCFVKRIEKQGQGICVMKRKAANGTKYTVEQKQAVVRKALQIQSETGQPIKKCYVSAGRLMGVNGISVHMQFIRGIFSL